MSHLEVRLEKDLTAIRARIAEQAQAVAKAVDDSVRAVQTGDRELAGMIILNDHPINRRTREIERECHHCIAVHLPSAGPLRLLSAVLKANLELERVGDYAVTISREVVQMTTPPHGPIARELAWVAGETARLLRQSIDAFDQLNPDLARGAMPGADKLGHNMDAVYEALMAQSDREGIKDQLATFVVFTQLKRVSDLAKNLCEHAIFAATGEQKTSKRYPVLFVDRNGSSLGVLALAIAQHRHPAVGRFAHAALEPGAGPSAGIAAFLQEHELPAPEASPQTFGDILRDELAMQHVLICLEGEVSDFVDDIPFHTTALAWRLQADDDPETTYRELAMRIADLAELLRGKDVD